MSVTVELMGGLGNNLFQLAGAIGTAHKNNDTVEYPYWKYAEYFEGDFTQSDHDKAYDKVHVEKEFAYNPIPYSKNLRIEKSYLQSEKYFEHCKNRIRNTFRLKPRTTNIDVLSNSCSIHIRRGDYRDLQQFHPLLTWEKYYSNAVEKMISTYNPNGFYLFSDEIDSVKKEFPHNEDFKYVETGNVIDDFYLMSRCKYHIIANSSLSWWSAWLGKYDNGLTIYPKEDWFGPAYAYHSTKDLFPKSWRAI